MGSGGDLSRPSSNFLDYENDECVETYFVDAREKPGSINPITSNRLDYVRRINMQNLTAIG